MAHFFAGRIIPVFLAIFIINLYVFPSKSEAGKKSDYFASLKARLINDGFDAGTIKKIYKNPKIKFDFKGVSLYFIHSEGKLDYDQFLAQKEIIRAKKYINNHLKTFIRAEQGFGVERYVIAAILLVETRFGTYTGKRYVINTLSTMAALKDKKVKAALWKKIKDTTYLSKKEFGKKAGSKADWAYNELKAFLEYIIKEKKNPFDIKGSYAGAMGYCQFMPSNILLYGKDGNRDGSIDLFTHEDAIMSIAKYLANYGWYSDITDKEAFRVVYQYNHSEFYVNTVLKIAEKLEAIAKKSSG